MLDSKESKALALLAHLDLTQGELLHLQKDLESILRYVDTLDKMNTSKVKTIGHITGLENAPRPDKEESVLSTPEILLAASSLRVDSWVKVAKIINRDSL